MLLLALSAAPSAALSSGGRVSVTVRTPLVSVSPEEARTAWLDYAWSRGGGLPLVGTLTSDAEQSRTLLPLLLREQLVAAGDDDQSCVTQRYTVTDAGPVLGVDVVAGSHEGKVVFAPTAGGGTEMVWSVGFDTCARNALWEGVTRSTVGEVSANLEATLRQPAVFTLTASLACRPAAAADAWLQCLADNGLGVPLPPPIVLNEGDKATREGWERLVLPPGLRERILRVERTADAALVEYTVVNPSWITCYPAHSHLGTVAFTPGGGDGGTTTMRWTVAARPCRGGAPLVRLLTSTIVPAFARNLAGRLGDAEAAEVTFSWDD